MTLLHQTVLVTGAPRSGTSWLASAVAAMGYDAGERTREVHAVQRRHGQEERYEDPAVLRINGDLFAAQDRHASYPVGPLKQFALADTVRALLEDDKDGPYLLKDPGIAWHYPSWASLYPQAPVAVAVRHPMAMAASYCKAFGFTLDRALEVWASAYAALLRWSAMHPDLFHWVSFPQGEGLGALAQALGSLETADPDGDRIHHAPHPLPDRWHWLEGFYHTLCLHHREMNCV